MPAPIARRYVLDESKRQMIVALLCNGSSRRVAARYVGCAASTITRTAARDPEFAAQLARAEETAELHLLRSIQAAARKKRHWRAAAWLLERRNPDDFASRPPQVLTAQQVADFLVQIVELLHGDLPEENCRRALKRLDDWLFELKQVAYLAYATDHPEARIDPPELPQIATDGAATACVDAPGAAPPITSEDCSPVADGQAG